MCIDLQYVMYLIENFRTAESVRVVGDSEVLGMFVTSDGEGTERDIS